MGKKSKHVKENDKQKPWFNKQSSARQERNIAIKKTFLIYCEGKNTEPAYFNSFPVTTQTDVKAIGLGRSRTALVKEVIELTNTIEKDNDQEIWVVFDRDVKYENLEQGNKDFNNAIEIAKREGINCAFSNDCFELWLVLHEEYTESSLHRTQIFEKLSEKTLLTERENAYFVELDKNVNYIQYLISPKKEFHFSSLKTNTIEKNNTKLNILINALKIKPTNIIDWMCAPIYRDAIIFYDTNKEIISCLNICFSCEKMELEKLNHIIADTRTYELLKEFFINHGHHIE